jgi:hypothetical protein
MDPLNTGLLNFKDHLIPVWMVQYQINFRNLVFQTKNILICKIYAFYKLFICR